MLYTTGNTYMYITYNGLLLGWYLHWYHPKVAFSSGSKNRVSCIKSGCWPQLSCLWTFMVTRSENSFVPKLFLRLHERHGACHPSCSTSDLYKPDYMWWCNCYHYSLDNRPQFTRHFPAVQHSPLYCPACRLAPRSSCRQHWTIFNRAALSKQCSVTWVPTLFSLEETAPDTLQSSQS